MEHWFGHCFAQQVGLILYSLWLECKPLEYCAFIFHVHFRSESVHRFLEDRVPVVKPSSIKRCTQVSPEMSVISLLVLVRQLLTLMLLLLPCINCFSFLCTTAVAGAGATGPIFCFCFYLFTFLYSFGLPYQCTQQLRQEEEQQDPSSSSTTNGLRTSIR